MTVGELIEALERMVDWPTSGESLPVLVRDRDIGWTTPSLVTLDDDRVILQLATFPDRRQT